MIDDEALASGISPAAAPPASDRVTVLTGPPSAGGGEDRSWYEGKCEAAVGVLGGVRHPQNPGARSGAAVGRPQENHSDAGDDPDGDSPDVGFQRFVAARWSALQRYAYLLTGDQQTAEDVVQSALEKCWPRWREIRSSSPEAYVRAAIANVASSRGRRRRVAESPLDDE